MNGPVRRSERALRAALPGWISARAIVLGTLALARFIVDRTEPANATRRAPPTRACSCGTAAGTRGIAREGYAALPDEALRFFPLRPPAHAGLAAEVTRLATGTVLLVIVNASALALGALLYELARFEAGDDETRLRRAAWLIAIAPPAYVLVLGYTEATATLLAVAMFFGLRTRRWGWAALAGVLAGLVRPVGILLVIPAAIESLRGLRAVGARERMLRVAATLAPAAGAGIYLGWVGARFDDWLLPLRVQQRAGLRGEFTNPFSTLADAARSLFDGGDATTGLHLPWVLVLAALVVVAFRHWPASYGAFALAMLIVGVSSSTLNSIERYALSAFPFVLAAASVTGRGVVERMVFLLSAAPWWRTRCWCSWGSPCREQTRGVPSATRYRHSRVAPPWERLHRQRRSLGSPAPGAAHGPRTRLAPVAERAHVDGGARHRR